MKNVSPKIPGNAIARTVLLATAVLSPLLPANQVNADLLDSLKKAAEQVIQEEIKKAIDVQPEQAVQTQPDMAVYEMQIYLAYLGYDVGLPDGMRNDLTTLAIRTYQLDSGLPVTGVVTAELLASVKVAYTHYAQTGQRPGSDNTGSNQPVTSATPNYTTMQTTSPVINTGSTGGLTPTAAPTFGQSGTAANSSGSLASTASYEQPSAGASNSAFDLNVPDRWSTIENGIVIPHPVSIDGRLLTAQAIEHYGQWMGLADRRAANAALAEYLELVGAGIRPGDIEKNPMRYVMFLSKSERDRYLCPTQPMTAQEIVAGISGKLNAGCKSMVGELVWAGSNEFETRRSRQNFIDDYRDRLVAAAPELPIKFLDTGDATVSAYDATKHGFTILSLEEYFGLTKGPHHRATPATRKEQSRGEPLSGGGINLWIADEPKVIGEPSKRYSSAKIHMFWPMNLDQAEALINRLWADMTPERKIFTRFHRTLTEYGPVTGTPTAIQAKMLTISAVAYEDPLFERELLRLNIGGEASSAQSAPISENLVSSSTVAASAKIDPLTGGPEQPESGTGSANITGLASSSDWLLPIEIPLHRGAPVFTFSGIGWEHESSALHKKEPLSLYFNLARLGSQPEHVAIPDIAGQHLTENARSPYMAEFRDRQRKVQCCRWAGTNEIEAARSKENFVREFTPRFVAAAPKLPFDSWLILELRIGNYDFERSGFGIRMPSSTPKMMPVDFEFPDHFLSVSPDKAESMIEAMHGHRVVYLAILVEVSSVMAGARTGGRNPFGVRAQNQLKSVNLYSDKAMTQLIQNYH